MITSTFPVQGAVTSNTAQPQEQLSPPPTPNLIKASALAAIDTTGRVVNSVESVMNSVAHSVNTLVPATVRGVCSFLPIPEVVTRTINGAAETTTNALTWLTNSSAQFAIQAATFGAPAWSQAIRQGVAVSGAAEVLNKQDGGSEFLARCIAESSDEPLIKGSLLAYLDARKELKALRTDSAEGQSARVQELARDIASYEVKLRDYQDFRDLKQVLEQGSAFVEHEHKRINELALEKADRIIAHVEHYYQDELGSAAGTVKGTWEDSEGSGPRAESRDALRDKIAARLQKVFDRELSSEETTKEISNISGDLHSAFGSYRSALKAAVSTVLGVGVATGALKTVLSAVWSGAEQLFGHAASRLGEGMRGLCSMVSEAISSRLEAIAQSIKDAGWEMIATPIHKAAETASEIAGVVSDGLSTAGETVQDALTAVDKTIFGPSAPDYSHPYWTGSSRVMVGVDDAFQPVYGESCISGFPSQPRVESITSNISGLADFFQSTPAGPSYQLDAESAADFVLRRLSR